MFKEAKRAAWVEIDLANLSYNLKSIREKVGSKPDIIGVVKADGYGHGSIEITRALKKDGIKIFGVATLSEAIELRKDGVEDEIIIFGITPDLFADVVAEYSLSPVTCSYQNALAISDVAKKFGKTIYGYVKIDTGMGRIGIPHNEPDAVRDIGKISALPNFKIKGLFSHFSTADAADKSYTEEQSKRFSAFLEKLRAAGIDIRYRSLANSGAIMQHPATYYEAVRPGIILYGYYPCDESDRTQISIKPVMSVKASIVMLKKMAPGNSVSYGRRFITDRESLIATLPVGYADGFPRPYSPVAQAIVGGKIVSVAGNICMDQCMIDVTDVPGVKVGDEVILMGSDGKNSITVDDLCNATGTICNEIVCAFGQRLPRIYNE